MNDIYNKKTWSKEQFDEECKKWLLFLLELVKYDHNLLGEFISSKCYAVAQHHQSFIADQVGCIRIYLCM